MRSPARYWNIALGVWLFVSAFLWPHSNAQFTNTWVCGLLCVTFALAAFAYPLARYLNTALAVWLFISAWVLPTLNVGTVWNNVIVAIAIFFVSLVPSGGESLRRGLPPSRRAPRPKHPEERELHP